MLKTSKGFTLMEVMISMFIMASLTVLVSTSIRTAVKNKQKLEQKIASETSLYDTLRVLKLDIERAFNYQDVFYEIERLALIQLEEGKKNPGAKVQSSLPPRPRKLTHFLGENSDVHFTTLNHFRTKYNAQESNQMEVGYFLESCKSSKGKGTSQCLWRRTSPLIDDRVDDGGARVVLAENVTTFRLSYRNNKEDAEWVKQWRTDDKGRGDHRNRFPHLVKIELAIDDKDDKKVKEVKQTIVVRLQFPNNEPLITAPPPKQKVPN